MSVAVVTFTCNESVNLPIWLRYYSANFGAKNLFVIDHGSTDGSTDNLGDVNRILLPRTEFDELKKTGFISSFHRSLLHHFDTVIYNDCDEIIVPDLSQYDSLSDYLSKRDFDYVTCVGLNVLHIMDRELPLDLDQPILQQRSYARFFSSTCKTVISRVPIKWMAGIHSCDKLPQIDPQLFLFHTKTMDYSIAVRRHRDLREIAWSQECVDEHLGDHFRYEIPRFVRESFLDPMNSVSNGQVGPCEFSEEIAQIMSETHEEAGVFFKIPMDIWKVVEIPEQLKSAF
jgi:hypothetical protein